MEKQRIKKRIFEMWTGKEITKVEAIFLWTRAKAGEWLNLQEFESYCDSVRMNGGLK